ncbi:MAG: hypothetical protein CMO33_08850 [Verrucomicrobia bacterium]|nr:hypothetical protein [Verrucomicrobiota bacterium]
MNCSSPSKKLDYALAVLKERGHRLTSPRRAILELMAEESRPLAAEDIRKQVERQNPCDLATVYRNMDTCLDAGIVQKCMLENGKILFELVGEHDHHHHIICRKCERTERINLCLADEMEEIATSLGFTEVDHVMELYGVCGDCRKAS